MTETKEKVKDVLEDLTLDIPEIMNRTLGILSLTEHPGHHLMWSHYSASHSGMVLIFDESQEFFQSSRKTVDDIIGVRRVKYSSERPSFEALLDMSMLDEDENSEIWASWIDKLFYTKSLHWEYEQEWRMLRPLKEASKIMEAPEGNIHLFSLPSSCIQGVILGQRMTNARRAPIIEFLRSDNRYSHVKLYEARLSKKDFSIEICPI